MKPSLRQIAFDGGLSTDGYANMKRCVRSALAASMTSAVPAPAMPRPWNAGITDQPVS